MDHAAFGRRLAAVRHAARVTLDDVDRFGLRDRVEALETGAARATPADVFVLAVAYGVPVAAFVGLVAVA